MKVLFVIILGIISIRGPWALGADTLRLGEEFSREFGSVLIDLRKSRGGNGDVAAGYLTLMALLKEYRIQNKVTLLVDREGSQRLAGLLSTNYPLPLQVQIKTLETLDRTIPFDFYMALASPSGTLKNKPKEVLNLTPEAVLLVQTVLGNSENPLSIDPMALVEFQKRSYSMNPAGIGPNELGIYSDFIAQALRGRSQKETQQFLLNELNSVTSLQTQSQLRALLTGQALAGARMGLVYGITSGQTRPQFTSYLEGLARHAKESFCLVTPSKFDLSFVDDPKLKARIVLLSQSSELPTVAEPGKIYILTIPNIPHPVFVGLTYYSMKQGVTPVGAGDGFMSAALILGEPFVLTRVPWNERNIQNLKELLIKTHPRSVSLESETMGDAESLNEAQLLLSELFDNIDLHRALELQKYRTLFQRVGAQIPLLTEAILRVALGVRHQLKENVRPDLLPEVLSSTLGLQIKDPSSFSSTAVAPSSWLEDENSLEAYMMESLVDSAVLSEQAKQILLGRIKGNNSAGACRAAL